MIHGDREKQRRADRHRLVSFYASDELLAWIEEEMGRTGLSKTQVIVHGLEELRQASTTRGGPSRRTHSDQ